MCEEKVKFVFYDYMKLVNKERWKNGHHTST